MFTFSHVTSIGISQDEYLSRQVAGETNLVKGENKFYREIATEVTVPITLDEFVAHIKSETASETFKIGGKEFHHTPTYRHFITGLKLSINQKVQAANRDGDDGPSNGDVVSAVIRHAKDTGDDALFARACGALASQKTVKAFATAWMAEHPDFEVSAK